MLTTWSLKQRIKPWQFVILVICEPGSGMREP